MDTEQFGKQQLAFRAHVTMLRSYAGKGAGDEWKNFIVRRELRSPAFAKADVGKLVDVEGDEIRFASAAAGVLAVPSPLTDALQAGAAHARACV